MNVLLDAEIQKVSATFHLKATYNIITDTYTWSGSVTIKDYPFQLDFFTTKNVMTFPIKKAHCQNFKERMTREIHDEDMRFNVKREDVDIRISLYVPFKSVLLPEHQDYLFQNESFTMVIFQHPDSRCDEFAGHILSE